MDGRETALAPKRPLKGAMLTAQQRISKPSLFGDVAERLKAAVC